MNTLFEFRRTKDGPVLFSEELINLNSLAGEAQADLDMRTYEAQRLWPSRFASLLEEQYKVNVTPTEAFFIAKNVSERMREVEELFSKPL